jgi:hypothetical protein
MGGVIPIPKSFSNLAAKSGLIYNILLLNIIEVMEMNIYPNQT